MNGLRERWRGLDRRGLDAAGGLALFALMAGSLWTAPPDPVMRPSSPLAYLLAAAVCLPFGWHRRHPTGAVLATGLAVVAYSAWHFSAYPGWALFAIVFATSLHSPRRWPALSPVIAMAALAVALSLQPSGVADLSSWLTSALTLTVAALAGENLRGRRARWVELEERARRLEREREERARAAVTAERLRIARELHDVVAHSMSVIAVQAGVANHLLEERADRADDSLHTLRELARPALANVESTARSALVEMRRLLGVLRQPEESGTAGREPAPGLAQLPTLIAGFERAGLTVRLRMQGRPEELPEGIDLSTYRIVQEGLTNVMRHGGPVAELTLTCGAEGSIIEICNEGHEGAADPSPPGARKPKSGPGHGLIGIRERVAVFGGEFAAGALPDGGFRLRATLPAGGAP